MKPKKAEVIGRNITEDGKTQVVISISAEYLEEMLEQISLFLMTEQNLSADEVREAFQVVSQYGEFPEEMLEEAIRNAEQQADEPVSEQLS
ncbi:MAG: hypothetical protein IJ225_08460 [Solobacterium sp.]|nr:hypothetical protein [Solobacterium sp.]